MPPADDGDELAERMPGSGCDFDDPVQPAVCRHRHPEGQDRPAEKKLLNAANGFSSSRIRIFSRSIIQSPEPMYPTRFSSRRDRRPAVRHGPGTSTSSEQGLRGGDPPTSPAGTSCSETSRRPGGGLRQVRRPAERLALLAAAARDRGGLRLHRDQSSTRSASTLFASPTSFIISAIEPLISSACSPSAGLVFR